MSVNVQEEKVSPSYESAKLEDLFREGAEKIYEEFENKIKKQR
jgi:hypothetical protein